MEERPKEHLCNHCYKPSNFFSERKNWTPAPHPTPEVALIGDLEPCPFCGSIELSCNGHSVECDICGAEGPALHPVPDDNAAKKMWNRRAKQPAPVFTVEQIERIKAWLIHWEVNRNGKTLYDSINDPQDGINAVTERKGG